MNVLKVNIPIWLRITEHENNKKQKCLSSPALGGALPAVSIQHQMVWKKFSFPNDLGLKTEASLLLRQCGHGGACAAFVWGVRTGRGDAFSRL